MDWNAFLEFTRGPLYWGSLLIFIAGLLYRLVRVIMLGWSKDYSKHRGSTNIGIVKTWAKSLLIWPFIPWVKGTFKRNPIMYIAGGLFHLGLLAIIFLGAPHMLVWKSQLGFGWPTLPLPIIDWLAVGAIISMLILITLRFTNPVMKMLSGLPEWLNWLFVFLPMISGYIMTHHLFFRYEVAFSLHMLSVDWMLIWIPFSRLSHFIFYPFSRTTHGIEWGKYGVTP